MAAAMSIERSLSVAGRIIARWWAPLTLVAVWHWWIWFADVPAIIAPSPSDVARELADPEWLVGPLLSTVLLTVLGIGLGLGTGVVLAVVCWWVSPARTVVIPPAVLAQTVPLVVFIPVLGRLVGYGTPSVVSICVVIGFFPGLVFVDAGLSRTPQARHEMVQVFGASRFRYLVHVALPTAIPGLGVAVRLTAAFAFLGSVTAEYMVGSGGIGRLLANSQFLFRTSRSWAIALTVIAASVALYSGAGVFERWANNRFEVAER
jgi:ABC-type nitrate/sulfonate/bicarbonate transport system permease component